MRAWGMVVGGLVGAPIYASAQVPVRPPDSLPAWFKDDSSWTHGHQCAGTLKRVLGVYFRDGTSQQARQEAVASVRAIVVGGLPLSDGDGAYYLRLPIGDTEKDLEAPAAELGRLPQVEMVFPELCASLGGLRRK
jgi:hypothetical protein